MRLPGISAGLLLGVALAAVCAGAQAEKPAAQAGGSTPAASLGPDQTEQIYASAKPYFESPLRDLKDAVPALDGLKADPSQTSLQSILDRTSQAIQAQVPNIPDLIARESVWQTQLTIPAKGQETEQDNPIVVGGGRRRSSSQYMLTRTVSEKDLEDKLHLSLLTGAPWKNFEYMMLFRPSPQGRTALEESRTDVTAPSGGKPESQPDLHGTGFGYIWLLFLPENMPQANYRFLGRQKMYGHQSYVVTFAQSADRVTVPGKIIFQGNEYPLLYQGVAWIDEATFHIVRLRTDLLAPVASIQLQWLRSDLRFSEVRIPELDLPLWLPRQVELTWRQADELGGEMHIYTKYRLFHATARMLPPN